MDLISIFSVPNLIKMCYFNSEVILLVTFLLKSHNNLKKLLNKKINNFDI